MRVPASPLHLHSVRSVFQTLVILIDVGCYLIVLICISLMTCDVECFFICHVYIFFGEVFGNIFNLCFNQIDFLMLSFKSSLYIWHDSSLSDVSLQIFTASGLSSNSFDDVFHRTEVFFFILMKSRMSTIYSFAFYI